MEMVSIMVLDDYVKSRVTLEEYQEAITEKDGAVESLRATIRGLKQKLNEQDILHKSQLASLNEGPQRKRHSRSESWAFNGSTIEEIERQEDHLPSGRPSTSSAMHEDELAERAKRSDIMTEEDVFIRLSQSHTQASQAKTKVRSQSQAIDLVNAQGQSNLIVGGLVSALDKPKKKSLGMSQPGQIGSIV